MRCLFEETSQQRTRNKIKIMKLGVSPAIFLEAFQVVERWLLRLSDGGTVLSRIPPVTITMGDNNHLPPPTTIYPVGHYIPLTILINDIPASSLL
jgi:hypothetical protein